MRTLPVLSCCVLLASLTACGSPGYYDSNGDYVAPAYAQRYHDAANDDGLRPRATYARPGYYDYYGNYVTMNGDMGVPPSMLPPRGLCRVWMPERDISRQPGVESCDGIQDRVPAGAYVIYGG